MLRFVDSFDHYAATDQDLKWTQSGGTGFPQLAPGRHGLGWMFGNLNSLSSSIGITLNQAGYWVTGWAAMTQSPNGLGGAPGLLSFLQVGVNLVRLVARDDNVLEFRAHFDTGDVSIGDSGAFVVHAGIWYYFEVKLILGFYDNGDMIERLAVTKAELRVDGAVRITVVNAKTNLPLTSLPVGTSTVNVLQYAGFGGTSPTTIDDLYICDGIVPASGVNNNDYLGDVEIDVVLPYSDQSPLQWNQFPATGAHFAKINEIPADRDATYLFQQTAGDTDMFLWGPIPSFSGTVLGVQMSTMARKDDEGSRRYLMVTKPTTATFNSGDNWVNDDYLYYRMIWDANPDTGNFWTQAEFNAALFGFENELT